MPEQGDASIVLVVDQLAKLAPNEEPACATGGTGSFLWGDCLHPAHRAAYRGGEYRGTIAR
jgi:hypothetical protein